MTVPFVLNHMTTAKLRYNHVLSLASELGCIGVEFRNDLPGALFDGDAPEKVRALANEENVRIFGLSEVKMFNVWSDERRTEAAALIEIAKAVGAESISLIPRCDGHGLGNGERQANLRVALRELLPMISEAGLIGFIEPLGFENSSLRFKAEALEAIEGVGGRGIFKLVHDTFHHTLAGETSIYCEDTGIVHVSGVVDLDVNVREMKDSHRILINAADRLGNITQLRELIGEGYSGPVSYEAFSPLVHNESKPFEAIKTSMKFVTHALEEDQNG
ncbi:MAG: sugar epimerase [Blastopirellula sp.]|nr:MAG: sugar epimerase [Blastopirellula sp.]